MKAFRFRRLSLVFATMLLLRACCVAISSLFFQLQRVPTVSMCIAVRVYEAQALGLWWATTYHHLDFRTEVDKGKWYEPGDLLKVLCLL